jgi:hypothetical protein
VFSGSRVRFITITYFDRSTLYIRQLLVHQQIQGFEVSDLWQKLDRRVCIDALSE